MATNKPCRFTNSELKALREHLPEVERRLLVKLEHYIGSPVDALCEEDKKQRLAAASRRLKKGNKTSVN